jgi:hypothetical protein
MMINLIETYWNYIYEYTCYTEFERKSNFTEQNSIKALETNAKQVELAIRSLLAFYKVNLSKY